MRDGLPPAGGLPVSDGPRFGPGTRYWGLQSRQGEDAWPPPVVTLDLGAREGYRARRARPRGYPITPRSFTP